MLLVEEYRQRQRNLFLVDPELAGVVEQWNSVVVSARGGTGGLLFSIKALFRINYTLLSH